MKKIMMSIIAISTLLIIRFCAIQSFATTSYLFENMSFIGYLDTVSEIRVQYEESLFNKTRLDNIKKKIENILLDIEINFSVAQTIYMEVASVDKSNLMIINERSGTKVKTVVDDDFITLLKMSIEIAEETGGGFDPTIGPLTNLWQISAKSNYCRTDNLDYDAEQCFIPTVEEIEEARSKVDYRKIEIDEVNKTVYLPLDGMKLDLGAIAKGYAADKVMNYLVNEGFGLILMSLGGNVYNFGYASPNHSLITTYLRNPFDRSIFQSSYFLSIKGNDQTVVTSGIYERYIEVDNVKYHHILNPLTGYPFESEIESVTIIHDYSNTVAASAFADAFATGVYALGLDNGLQYVEERDDIEAVFITKDKKVHLTKDINYQVEKGMTEEFELFVGGEKVAFTPGGTDDPINDYNPTKDLLLALVFIVVGFGAVLVLAFTLRRKNQSKEE